MIPCFKNPKIFLKIMTGQNDFYIFSAFYFLDKLCSLRFFSLNYSISEDASDLNK